MHVILHLVCVSHIRLLTGLHIFTFTQRMFS